MLATYHNLAFLYSMVQDIREAIQNDSFNDYYKNFLKKTVESFAMIATTRPSMRAVPVITPSAGSRSS